MTDFDQVDYGPLISLEGNWTGSKGEDVAPEPDGIENNSFYESICFSLAGDVTNAESQTLATVHYRQTVRRKSNDKVFHDETGYWMWDAERELVMHALTIPRGVSLIAGGKFVSSKDSTIRLDVKASDIDPDWPILQSPFMRDNARTLSFEHHIEIHANILRYQETTLVDIYGKTFEHTDADELIRE